MNEPTPSPQPSPGLPRWFGPAVVLMLSLQLGVLWVQGGLLNRQRSEIRSLREDIQALTEVIDQGWGSGEPLEGQHPMAHPRPPKRPTLLRVGVQSEEADDKVAQELKASQQSAQEAKAKGDDVQKKLSITENARIAEQKAQQEAEVHKWGRLVGAGMAAGLLLFVVRAWIRRR